MLCNVKWPFIQRISFYTALLPGGEGWCWRGLGGDQTLFVSHRQTVGAEAGVQTCKRCLMKVCTRKCPPTQLGHYQWIICSRPSIQIKYNVSLSENLQGSVMKPSLKIAVILSNTFKLSNIADMLARVARLRLRIQLRSLRAVPVPLWLWLTRNTFPNNHNYAIYI